MEFKKGGYIEFKWRLALQTSPRPGREERCAVGGDGLVEEYEDIKRMTNIIIAQRH